MNEREAFLQAVMEDPSEANRFIFTDWLHNHGEEELARWFRQPHPPAHSRLVDGVIDRDGYGYGFGHGDGEGYGDGDAERR